MLPHTPGGYSFTVALEDEQATGRLMADIAGLIEPGDLITLSGDLGAGKTAFARAFIRHVADDETIEVPSPTFTLMQSYDLARFPIVHADLYRLGNPGELDELGFDDAPDTAVTLLEWPDRAGGQLPPDRLDIALTLSPPEGETFRHAEITGYGKFAARAKRIAAIRRFLNDTGFGQASRRRIQGDASTRSYERLMLDGTSYILMNSPRRPDGPAVRDGKPYSAIAHLAETVTPFIAMARGLRMLGLSAPAIHAADRDAGLLVLEDLGNELVVEGDPQQPIEERYEIAADLLAALHRERTPDTLTVEAGVQYRVPRYDMDAMLIETELLLDWFLPLLGSTPDDDVRDEYIALWRAALTPALTSQQTWVMRDYHSPNIIWLPERDGINRVGLLDFQDAMMGSPAYDVASLLQDARVTVPELMEISLLSRYTRARMKAEPGFDAPAFARLYATFAAQRASKILGIFARLDRRDGKPQYLRHLPRVWTYLQRSLAHPDLARLAAWYRVNIPVPKVKS
jgi:tRNA threonylcarbamoyl adenosine modification protein YjeE